MGPKQSQTSKSIQQQFFSQYEIIQQIASQSIRFLQHKQSHKQYLLRELTYNDKKQYLKAIQTIKTKQQQLKNADHITPITQFFQKEEDQYCSTFYKLYVLFQYPQRTMDDQINERNLKKNNFSETQLWSILASCILGLGHLQKKGIRHNSLKSSMIFLSQQGHIKVSDPFTTGCQSNYQCLLNRRSTRHIYLSPQQCVALSNQTISPVLNPYKSDIFTLGMIVLECGLLQYQDQCYRDQYSRIHWETLQYNKNRFRRSYSEELGSMLDYMLGQDAINRPEWIQLEKLVVTDAMGKSFISDGRKSVIMGYSKPVSVDVHRFSSNNANNAFGSTKKSIIQPKSAVNVMPKSTFTKQIVTSKVDVLKNDNLGIYTDKKQAASQQGNRQFQFESNIKPQQLSIQKHASQSYSSQKPVAYRPTNQPYIPHLNQVPQLPQLYQIPQVPLVQQLQPQPRQLLTSSQSFYLPPVSVSNVSLSRPLRSIFPNTFYQIKTKADQNLIQLQEEETTNRSISEGSHYDFDHIRQTNGRMNSNHAEVQRFSDYNHQSNNYNQQYNYNQQSNYNQYNNYNQQSNYNQSNNFNQSNNYNQQQNNYNQQSNYNQQNNYNQSGNYNLPNQAQHHNKAQSYNEPNIQAYSNQANGMRKSSQTVLNSENNQQGQFVIETFKLGSRYQGYKLNGMRHGPGKFFYQDGGMYDGNWVANKMQGYGKLYYQSGKIAYQGQWIKDQFTGHGVLYNESPDILNQPYQYQNFNDVQQLWTKYEGQFSDDSKNGKGALYLSNGQYFQGHFINDTAEGEGVYTTINGMKVTGVWENNQLINTY